MKPRFTVLVEYYRLSPSVDDATAGFAYASHHTSPHAAGRRLASLIMCRTDMARAARRAVPKGHAPRMLVDCGDGLRLPLNAFRAKFCKESGR